MPTAVVLAQDATETTLDEVVTATESLPDDASDVEVSEPSVIDDGPGDSAEADDVDPLPEPTVVAEHERNNDSLILDSAPDHVELAPGQHHDFFFSYLVTTSRVSTGITAELRLADGSLALGWQVWASTGQGDWVGHGPVAEVNETGSIVPESSFALSVSITAPANATEPQSVVLHISSAVVRETGDLESGVEGSEPQAALTVSPPVPTQFLPGSEAPGAGDEATEVVDDPHAEIDVATPPLPTEEPKPEAHTTEQVIGALQVIAAEELTPTLAPAALVCDSSPAAEVVPAGYAELGCQYTVSGDGELPRVTASLVDVVGEGWEIAIGESIEHDTHWEARGEQVVWEASRPLGNGEIVLLLIRLFAPEGADPTHGATINVAVDGQPGAAFTWTVGIGAGGPIALTGVACSPTVSITSAPLNWGVTNSDATRKMDGELTYEIQTDATCGWSVSMAATWFTYSGSHNSLGFSPASISFESTGLVASPGVRESTVRGTLSRPVQLLAADRTTPSGTVEHTLDLAVNLPEGAAPGRYASTVTITVTGNGDPGG